MFRQSAACARERHQPCAHSSNRSRPSIGHLSLPLSACSSTRPGPRTPAEHHGPAPTGPTATLSPSCAVFSAVPVNCTSRSSSCQYHPDWHPAPHRGASPALPFCADFLFRPAAVHGTSTRPQAVPAAGNPAALATPGVTPSPAPSRISAGCLSHRRSHQPSRQNPPDPHRSPRHIIDLAVHVIGRANHLRVALVGSLRQHHLHKAPTTSTFEFSRYPC